MHRKHIFGASREFGLRGEGLGRAYASGDAIFVDDLNCSCETVHNDVLRHVPYVLYAP